MNRSHLSPSFDVQIIGFAWLLSSGGQWPWLRVINMCSLDRDTGSSAVPRPWEIRRACLSFSCSFLSPQLPLHKHTSSKNTDFDLLTFKYCGVPKAWKLHVSLLLVQYAQWEKFVIWVVAVGEIQISPFPSVPKAPAAWTSVCINEICHLHCAGFTFQCKPRRKFQWGVH